MKEERVISSLAAGINIQNFNQLLGIPLFSNVNNELSEYIYKRHGYWVQAVVDKNQTVIFYTVTVCDDTFKPKLPYNPVGEPVILGKTNLSEVTVEETKKYYFIRGATRPSHIIESASFGNPSNYQSVVWGLNETCMLDNYLSAEDRNYLLDEQSGNSGSEYKEKLSELRKRTRIDTFGMTATFIEIEPILNTFTMGVDPTVARTYQSQEN